MLALLWKTYKIVNPVFNTAMFNLLLWFTNKGAPQWCYSSNKMFFKIFWLFGTSSIYFSPGSHPKGRTEETENYGLDHIYDNNNVRITFSCDLNWSHSSSLPVAQECLCWHSHEWPSSILQWHSNLYASVLEQDLQMHQPFHLPIVMFPNPSVISLSLCSFSWCLDSVSTPFVHRSRFVNTEWITPNLQNKVIIEGICTEYTSIHVK